MSDWIATGLRLPPGFTPTACRVLSPTCSLCVGDGSVFRLEGQELTEVANLSGRFTALDEVEGFCWGLIEGKATRTSADAGASWTEPLPVPATNLTRLLAVSPTEAWVLGTGAMLRTVDGGRTWTPVLAPGARHGERERLVRNGPLVQLLTEGGIVSTRDGGHQWELLLMQTGRPCAVEGGAILALEGGKIRIGTPDGRQVTWVGSFELDADPVRLAILEEGACFLALPQAADVQGVYFFESLDAGERWDVQLIPGRKEEAALDLRSEGGFMLSPQGDIFVLKG